MQSWQQALPTHYHQNNPTPSLHTNHSQNHWETAAQIAQTEPWTFGARSGLAHRQAHHVPLPDVEMGNERIQPIFIPTHKSKARSMAMSITELVVPDSASSQRPVTAPASLNSVEHQSGYKLEVNASAPTAERMDERQDHVFRSASCQHQIPCLMGGLENVATQYKGVPSDGWRALDKLADMNMGPEEPIEEHIDHFCTIFHAHSQALVFFPVHLFAHLFFRSLAMYHDNLRKAGEYYLTTIDPQGTLGKLFAHLWNVEQTRNLLQGINNVERSQKRAGRFRSGNGKSRARGNPAGSQYSRVFCSMAAHSSSPESDIRTRISAWRSPDACLYKDNSSTSTGPLSDLDASMEISFNRPIGYQIQPYACEIKLPPIHDQHEGDFSNVEMDAVNIMMQLGRK